MKNFIYRFLGSFPSKNGQKSLDRLLVRLSHGGINFKISSHQDESGNYLVAEAEVDGNFIITSGKDLLELDRNIKDAIFTAYQVPRFYCDDKLITSPLVKKEMEFNYATR
ncbi:MAG: hypothetical protein NTZ18_04570 [Candidatus Komeilibacteria bacterium]|nr:hypothetical protein [Candidatus Komeilibacteria bacterium]